MATNGFTFEADRTADTVVVRLGGELDMQAGFQLEPELERLTRDPSTRALVVDMNGVDFMESTALGLLLALRATPGRRHPVARGESVSSRSPPARAHRRK